MTEIVLLAIALLLVLACGGFVAAEFAFVTINRSAVEAAAAGGDRKAQRVLAALRTLSTQLSGAQLGITVTNLTIGYLAEPSLSRLLQPTLLGMGLTETAARSLSLTLAMVIATAVTMILGELMPKNLAIADPMRVARAVVNFQRGFTWINTWPIRLFNGSANAILRLFGIEPQEELASARSAEELAALVRHSANEGTLASDTAELVERSLVFSDRRARDAMTPRSQLDSLRPEDSLSTLVSTAKATGHSRFPVIEVTQTDGHTSTEVRGLVHIRAALAVPFEQRDARTVAEALTPATMVPDSLELDTLLDDLRAGGLQMAVVIDEFGSLAGLITLEDLVEEIVGEVRDEHDEDELEARIEPDGDWTLPGLLRIDEVADLTEIDLPEGEAYDTVAGLLADQLDRLPEVGDVITVRAAVVDSDDELDVTVQVTAMDRHRVDEVRLHAEPAEAKEAAE